MSHECFDVTIDNGIAHLVLKRPEKRNSMIPSFWRELPDIVRDIDDNARARVIVISSTGPHFTAGLDIKAFQSIAAAPDEPMAERQAGLRFQNTVRAMQETFTCLERCRVPVLAAIQGGCIGGGVDLVTACDMRYATDDAFITIHEINIGMTADVGTFPRIFKLIPEGVARELAYTGRRMPAAEAQSVGLVNRVYPDQDTMLAEVMGIAREIAAKAPLAIHGTKRMANYARDHSVADTLDYVGVWNASMLQHAEIREAMQANAEKRPGEFADLPPVRPPLEGPE
ncbi:crotonase/enoyl-CoA hydratase family protein [Aquisalimonas sp. 2447]|uniref:crotonase/enoyl-CoA hydratase family protein n=1 Tax=Aquisalimonas sp. 2447 TaxID=2740807 RepID=UPI00143249FA|nr:crotonase/enoyl-CoA hydratase family protein [Aquisalimonas sp. 2447]QIT57009.1 crotonase/enoyl-CoA hydratase family protein [Aquisalimonas sp. 2447]